jgi:hypothetical protein
VVAKATIGGVCVFCVQCRPGSFYTAERAASVVHGDEAPDRPMDLPERETEKGKGLPKTTSILEKIWSVSISLPSFDV